MKKSINIHVPGWVKRIFKLFNSRHLVHEIRNLPVKDMGISGDGMPWVQLDDGLVFYGFPPTKSQRLLYRLMSGYIKNVDGDHFAVVFEIINRYLVPRSLPGETVFNPSKYMPIRDPLNDFNLSDEKRIELANLFRPKPGDIFVDIGAYLGYGTMRIANLVGPTGRVIAFESDPGVLPILRKNIEANNIKNILLVPKAVDSCKGEKDFFSSTGTVNSLNQWVLNKLGQKDLKKVRVETDAVDNVLKELSVDKINMVNITVNGGEIDALNGMKSTLQNSDNVRITLAGWYYLTDKNKVCDIAEPLLQEMSFITMVGRLGRVLAWKTTSSS